MNSGYNRISFNVPLGVLVINTLTELNPETATDIKAYADISPSLYNYARGGVFFGLYKDENTGIEYTVSFIASDSYAADIYGNALAITSPESVDFITFYGITTIEEANRLFNDLPKIGIDSVIINYSGDIE